MSVNDQQGRKEILTEENSEELVLADHPDEQVPVDVLYSVLLHLVEQPSQQLRLLPCVAYSRGLKLVEWSLKVTYGAKWGLLVLDPNAAGQEEPHNK